MKIRLKCRDAAQLLSERQDRRLGTADVLRLRLHLIACDACSNVEHQFDVLRRALRRLSDDESEGHPDS